MWKFNIHLNHKKEAKLENSYVEFSSFFISNINNYSAVYPPSTVNTPPVTKDEASYDKQDLTLITNSIKILNEFSDSHFQIISTGGELRKKSLSLVGPAAEATVNRYFADIHVFSCKGISLEHGITESNEPEAELKKIMLKNSKMNLLLVDHTKFDKAAFLKLFDLSDIDVLVTDKKPSTEWLEKLKANDVQLIY